MFADDANIKGFPPYYTLQSTEKNFQERNFVCGVFGNFP